VSSTLHSHASVGDTIQNSSLGEIPMTTTTPLTKPQDDPTTPPRVVIQLGNPMVENKFQWISGIFTTQPIFDKNNVLCFYL